MVGLFFFIRASVKDRTEQAIWQASQPIEELLPQLQTYFERRAYQVTSPAGTWVNGSKYGEKGLSLRGYVRPSLFLAFFLSFLAAIGLLCLALVLSLLFPSGKVGFLALLVLAPGAGIFYWKKAGRIEQVRLQVEAREQGQTQITIVAHRDELIQLYQTGKFKLSRSTI